MEEISNGENFRIFLHSNGEHGRTVQIGKRVRLMGPLVSKWDKGKQASLGPTLVGPNRCKSTGANYAIGSRLSYNVLRDPFARDQTRPK
ncbi:hypothetical protein GOBAR_DD20243 [Gossypium barbadense]|nr:hypothetical protein GOBAR_DD20243 [Gossypium barbadense]